MLLLFITGAASSQDGGSSPNSGGEGAHNITLLVNYTNMINKSIAHHLLQRARLLTCCIGMTEGPNNITHRYYSH